MNPATLVKNYLSIVENITSELDSLESFEPNYLIAQFNKLQTSFLNLAKLTNNGKGPSDLRTDKLKALKKWLAAYADKEQFLQSTVPQRHKNKAVAIDSSTLDTYQGYANLALNYMAEMPVKYQEIKDRALPALAMRKHLLKNVDSFTLDKSDLMAFAAKKDEVEGLVHTPAKTINSVRSILRAYGRFIKAVETATAEVLPVLDFFEDKSLETIYAQFNKRNRLLQSLVKNLSNIKKTIEQSTFQHKFAIMKEYQALLEGMTDYLPEEVISRLTVVTLTAPLQDQLDRSPKNVKRYDPLKDPEMNWPEPQESTPEPAKPVETMKDRVDRTLRHQELTEVSQRPGKTLSPADKAKYEGLWNREGLPVSPEKKKEYEALWEAEASEKLRKLVRLAKYLEVKYV